MYTKVKFSYEYIGKIAFVPVLVVGAYAASVYLIHHWFEFKNAIIPLSVTSILGTAISLLLGFRTNAAYDRWWEARKVWGAIVNDSRTLIRQMNGYLNVDPGHRKAIVLEAAQLRSAWNYSLRDSLRNKPMSEEVKRNLTEKQLARITGSDNIPNAILVLENELISNQFKAGHLDAFHFAKVDETHKHLCDAMGKCERIKKTVFPIQYALFTRVAIFIFMIFLPFGLVETVGALTMPISIVVVFFFSIIDLIARYMQDPFEDRSSDTPMSALSRTIERNLLQMVEHRELPDKAEVDEQGVLW